MTKDLKDLLLKDFCARLPYKVRGFAEHGVFKGIVTLRNINIDNDSQPIACYNNYGSLHVKVSEFKPYLFPLSSMTEEQAKEMQEIVGSPKVACIMRKTGGLELWLDSVDTDPTIWLDTIFEVQDWLNKNHFDYRGLIPKGLAKDATGLNIY